MCLPLIFIVLQVLALKSVEAIQVPYYNNDLFYDPWSPYQQTTGPVTFGGQVKAKGAVHIAGRCDNDGHGTFTSYSGPSTPLTVTSQQAFLTTASLAELIFSTATTLPTITSLPVVTLPYTTISQTFIDNVPSTVSVPIAPMPFIIVTTILPGDFGQNGNVASPVKFGGTVPASGRVKISAHYC